MRITTELLQSKSSRPLACTEYLDLSGRSIASIEKLECCPTLKTLKLNNNNIQEVCHIECCPQLWQLDLSNNKIVCLDGLSRFLALGTLVLSNNNLTWKDLLKIRHMHILGLSLHGNEQMEKNPHYRIHVIDCLPNIWMLDGRIITSAERIQVKAFFQDSALTDRPVRHMLSKEWFIPSSLQKIQVNGIFGEKARHMMTRFPANALHNIEIDQKRLKYLAYNIQEDLVLEKIYTEKNFSALQYKNTFLEDLLNDRPDERERCNMLLILLVASLEFQMPGLLMKHTLDTAKLYRFGQMFTIDLFLLHRNARCLVVSLLLAAVKIDRDLNENGGIYDELYLCLFYLVTSLIKLSQSDLKKITPDKYKSNKVYCDYKSLLASEVVQLLCIVPTFFRYLEKDVAGVKNLVIAGTGDPNSVESVLKLAEIYREQDMNSLSLYEDVYEALLQKVQGRARNITSKTHPKGNKDLELFTSKALPMKGHRTVAEIAEYHTLGVTSPDYDPDCLQPISRSCHKKIQRFPHLGDAVLLGPQTIGKIMSLPQPFLALVAMDTVPVPNGAMEFRLKDSSDHYTYVNMEQFEWSTHCCRWRPLGTVGDRFTIQSIADYEYEMLKKAEVWEHFGRPNSPEVLDAFEPGPLMYTPRQRSAASSRSVRHSVTIHSRTVHQVQTIQQVQVTQQVSTVQEDLKEEQELKEQRSQQELKEEESQQELKEEKLQEEIKEQKSGEELNEQKSEEKLKEQKSEEELKEQNSKEQQLQQEIKDQGSQEIIMEQGSQDKIEVQRSQDKIEVQGSQEEIKEQGSKEEIKEQGSQEEVKEQGIQEEINDQGSQEGLKKQGSQVELKEQGSQEKIKEQGSQEGLKKQGSQEELKKEVSQEELKKQGSQEKTKEQGSQEELQEQKSMEEIKEQRSQQELQEPQEQPQDEPREQKEVTTSDKQDQQSDEQLEKEKLDEFEEVAVVQQMQEEDNPVEYDDVKEQQPRPVSSGPRERLEQDFNKRFKPGNIPFGSNDRPSEPSNRSHSLEEKHLASILKEKLDLKLNMVPKSKSATIILNGGSWSNESVNRSNLAELSRNNSALVSDGGVSANCIVRSAEPLQIVTVSPLKHQRRAPKHNDTEDNKAWSSDDEDLHKYPSQPSRPVTAKYYSRPGTGKGSNFVTSWSKRTQSAQSGARGGNCRKGLDSSSSHTIQLAIQMPSIFDNASEQTTVRSVATPRKVTARPTGQGMQVRGSAKNFSQVLSGRKPVPIKGRPFSAAAAYRCFIADKNVQSESVFNTDFQHSRTEAWKKTARMSASASPLYRTANPPPPQRPTSPVNRSDPKPAPKIHVTRTDNWLAGGRDIYWDSYTLRVKPSHTPGWKEGLPESMKRPKSAYCTRNTRRPKLSSSASYETNDDALSPSELPMLPEMVDYYPLYQQLGLSQPGSQAYKETVFAKPTQDIVYR